MAKQLNVNLAFTADTGKAKQQLQELQQSLDRLISNTNSKTTEFGLTKELAQATTEASKLKIMLESATTSSGTLDLGKFSQGLKKQNLELKDYAETLQSLGPEGAKAFAKLSQSITTANIPLKQTNRLLHEFATTMKNTVRWQLSSSMLHGFMGSISGALSYAKDLDKSLNDIRIVTGYNVDQMAQFANEANKAAKALSATTTDYTNASLIYYQQGLGEEEIAERTEVTLKMANAAGVSAEKVSDQMTAVWNNFDDGSKSLEYYADVMTALGAATASSTDEISQGLNKFAAVAESVGLSYEYATSALATVTATTRQSADIVGTAFKTLFARIQGLNLGETLDDGTTLNKYSSALEKVGINIKDTNGEMKQMDTILDEMGAKWESLAKDQQIALAQTVAGVRQYTQLIALMDNWDYFKENVEVAENSTGTLKEQADIYAESWEASSKRVKAAAEGIYDKLLDETFFIGVNKILEGTLSTVGNLIDGLGGLPGVLSIVSSLMLNAFGKEIASSIERIAYNIKLSSKAGQEAILKMRKEANQQTREMYSNSADSSINNPAKVDIITKQTKLQDQLIEKTFKLELAHKSLTEEEQKQAQLLLDQNQILGEQYEKIVKIKNESEMQDNKSIRDISTMTKGLNIKDKDDNQIDVKSRLNEIKKLQVEYSTGITILEKYKIASRDALNDKSGSSEKRAIALQKIKEHLNSVLENAEKTGNEFTKLDKILKTVDGIDDLEVALNSLEESLEILGSDSYTKFEEFRQAIQNAGGDMSKLNPQLNSIWDSFTKTGELTEEQIQIFANYGVQIDKSGKIIEGFKGKIYTTADSLVAVSNILTNFSMILNSIQGLSDIWTNEDLTYGEKIVSTLTSLGMVLGTLVSTYSNFNKAKLLGFKTDLAQLALSKNLIVAKKGETAAELAQNGALTTQIALEAILKSLNLKKIAIYAALALAIGGVIALGKRLYDQYHADAQGAKEAAEQAKVLTERYEELKNKAQELNDAIADYQDARDALTDLKKGTEEYRSALEKANEQAKQLIETYGLWNDYTYEGGLIEIDPSAIEEAKVKANETADQARIRMYQGEIYSNQASIRNETTNLQRKGKTFYVGDPYDPYNPSDTNIGYNSEDYRKLNNQEVQNIAKIAVDLKESLGGGKIAPTAEQLIKKLRDLGVQSGLDAEALNNLHNIIENDSIEGFLSLGESMAEAEKANRYYSEQILGMAIEDKYGDKISSMVTKDDETIDEIKYNQILTAFTKRAANIEEEKNNNTKTTYEQVEGKVKDISNTKDLNSFLNDYEKDNNELINKVLGGNYDGSMDDDKELGLLYAQMMYDIDKSELTYKKGKGVGTIKDKEGNVLVDGVSDEVMRREIAKQVAMQKITDDYTSTVGQNSESLQIFENSLNKLLEGTSKVEDEFGADFSGAILDAIANENYESLNFSNLFSELDPKEMAKLSGLDSQGILDLLGIDKPTLEALGYDVDTFTLAFAEALDNWIYTLDTANIEEKIAGLKEIADEAKIGDIINQEDYDKLITAGVTADKYFTKMEDGTYKLTGAAKEFQNVVENITIQDYINKIKEFRDAQEYAKNQINDQYGSGIANNVTKTSIVGSNKTLGAARADFIKTFEGDFNFTEEQQAILNKNSSQYTSEDLQELANMMNIVISKSSEMQGQMLSTADSLDELNSIINIAKLEGVPVDYNAYSNALLGLASSYESCSIEIEKYQNALSAGNQEQISSAEALLKASMMIGEAAEKFGLNAEEVKTQAKLMSDELELSAESSAELAIQNQRMNKGVKNLNDNWKEWKETLTTVNKDLGKVDKTSMDYAKALKQVNEAVRDLTGVHEDFEIPSEFYDLPGIMEDVEKASEGDIKAINTLGLKLAEFSIGNLEIDTDFMKSAVSATDHKLFAGFDSFESNKSKVLAGIQELQTAVINGTTEIGGAAAGMDADWATALNEMAMQTGMSVDEMNSLLSAAGVDAEVVTKYVPQKVSVPVYETTETVTPGDTVDGVSTYVKTSKTVQTGVEEMDGVVPVAQINMGENGKEPNVRYIGNGNVSPKETGTSTSGKSKRPRRTHQSETVERYKEVTDKIDDTTDAIEDARRAAEGLWGPARIKKMREVQNEMKKEIGLLREKKVEAENYLRKDQEYLESVGRNFGITFQFENGNISNYTAIMNDLQRQLEDAEKAAGSDPTDAQQKALDDIEYKISEIKKAIGIYDETRETLEDIDNEIEDKILELQQEKLDEINLELEIDLVVNETQLKELEYYLSKLEDNFFGMAEALALMIGNNENGFNQLSTYQDSLIDYQEQYARLLSNYTTIDPTTGATYINQAQFIEGLQEVQDGLYENLGALQDLSKEMIHYYGDVLAAAGEELEKFTSLMDHHIEVLDHYANLLDLLGRSKDFKSMKTVLAAQVETAENAAKVSKANYDMLEEEARKKKEILDNTTYEKDSYEYSVIEQEFFDARNAANAAQDQMLSDAEAWAESLKALLETELDELADILEKSLSGEFGTLDNMIESMERANSLQEEYLTSTNQIYETNKLMRQAQQEIDKSTNSIAKRRLKQFIDETNQMQNQNKLSQFELDIQKAKYDLLLAEIALEEAQQAKSTVRLQRDSEGNFGYVYTADQNEIAQAQQDLEDAQNNLYNIGLEGANKYGESYAQTIQQMHDDITALTQAWLNGEIASKEEYQRRMLELEKFYSEKLMQYSELRTIALGVDSRIAADAWTKDFAHMTTQTEMWMKNVDQYAYNVEVSMGDYQKKVDEVEEFVGLDLDSLKDKTKNITDENKALASTIQDDLIPKIKDEITAVSGLTAEYIKLYDQIRNVISASETLANSIGKTIKNESDNDDSNNLQPTGVGTSDSTGSSGNSGAGQISVGGKIDAGSAEIHDFPGAPGERQYFRNDPTYTVLEEQGDWIKVRHHSLSSGVTGWFRKGSVAAMNTGGYTGDWAGSYGKLAFLHQKEMVLNAQDTENLLTSIEFLDKIISTIDLYSSNARLGGLLSTPSYGGFGNADTLEQNVHIEASFPNVSDHNEIEEALNNLINKASQYAYRK